MRKLVIQVGEVFGVVDRITDDIRKGGIMLGTVNWVLTKALTDEKYISDFEKEYDIIFPAEYKATIIESNGGRPRPNVFDSVDRIELVAKSLLSFDKTHKENIWDTYDQLKNHLSKDVIPFMSDQFGNYVCFDYRNTKIPSIVFWDHELSNEHLGSVIIDVVDSYIEFLDSLYNIE